MVHTWKHRQYLITLTAVFSVFWIWLAIDPVNRRDWAVENMLVVAFLVGMILARHRFTFSRVSYTLIFLVLCLHAIGAHFTYSLVPYDALWKDLTGRGFNELVGWERNHYDRLVHFAYGLCLAYPMRELFLRIADARGFWGYFLPFDLTLSTSALFEMMEWAGAALFEPSLAAAYLGTQGDEWDAQKDMSLAALGALIAMLVTVGINWRMQRDFGREWAESLRIKDRAPHGEEAIKRMKRTRARR